MIPRTVRLTFREPPPGSAAANSGIPCAPPGSSVTVLPPATSQIGWQCMEKPREEVTGSEFYGPVLDAGRYFAFTTDAAIAPVVGNHWSTRLEVVRHWPRMPASAAFSVETDNDSGATILDRGLGSFVRSPEMPCEYFFGKSMLGESISSAYAHVVEYDLDDQDVHWLNIANAERIGHRAQPISMHDMVLLMDCFEKGWYALSRAPRRLCAREQFSATTNSAVPCDICRESDTALDNLIVICDGCNIAVHQDCYGVALVPEGPWFCQRCVSGDTGAACAVCPWKAGPMQRTSDKHAKWIHASCASFLSHEIPQADPGELRNLSGILVNRWKLSCVFCKNADGRGAPLQCTFKNCCTALHLGCAASAKCTINWKTHSVYCWKHSFECSTPDVSPCKLPLVNVGEEEASQSHIGQCRNLFQQPTIPQLLIDTILRDTDALAEFSDDVEERTEAMQQVARYWALKKARVRGASLVKCLDIDPWSTTTDRSVIAQKCRILGDLKTAASLAHSIVRRESLKRMSLLYAQDLLRSGMQPLQTIFLVGCALLRKADKDKYFEEPVLASEVPDYYSVVTNPCCLQSIVQRVMQHDYADLDAFFADVQLIHDNAVLYNEPDTVYHEAAVSFLVDAYAIREKLRLALDATRRASFVNARRVALDAILGPYRPTGNVPIALRDSDADSIFETSTPAKRPRMKASPRVRSRRASASQPDTCFTDTISENPSTHNDAVTPPSAPRKGAVQRKITDYLVMMPNKEAAPVEKRCATSKNSKRRR